MPDDEFGEILRDIFGDKPHVFRKYQRMMYWMPKFKNANPYPVPRDMPEDPIELAKAALNRMAVDLQNYLSVFQVECALLMYCYIQSSSYVYVRRHQIVRMCILLVITKVCSGCPQHTKNREFG